MQVLTRTQTPELCREWRFIPHSIQERYQSTEQVQRPSGRATVIFEGPLFAGSINPGLLAAKAKAWLAFEDSNSDIQKAPKQMNLRG